MSHARKSIVATSTVVVFLALAGCSSDQKSAAPAPAAKADHPKADHPKADHPKAAPATTPGTAPAAQPK